jgi:2-isopropylmalate synthase
VSRCIYIFDTTLRDGEQTPGISLDVSEKLQIARQLELLNVDAMEAGFPMASKGDFEAVKAIAKEIKKSTVVGLARATKEDIDCAWEALRYAAKPRIHTFLATSDIHMEYKLKMKPEEVLERATKAVSYAKSLCPQVEFSPEDASRTRPEFLYQVLETVIDAGADIVNIPDTVGYCTPDEYGRLIKGIKENVPNIDKAIISVHCHNDLGLAVANSLAAIENGADQVECTINGLGERAGNAALEEIVMALKTRNDSFNIDTRIDTEQIYRTSTMVNRLTGVQVQPNKAIVGANAFAHESGIHQHGVLANAKTYEIMTPESIGLKNNNNMVLGKHSGRHAFEEKLKELQYNNLTAEQINEAFSKFKDLADKKKAVEDKDIEALVSEQIIKIEEVYTLEYFQIFNGNTMIPTSTVRVKKNDEVIQVAACGDGPVDATFKAIDQAIGVEANEVALVDYSIKSVTSGKEALGEVTVKISKGDAMYIGRALSVDIIEASAKAYINALNKFHQAIK